MLPISVLDSAVFFFKPIRTNQRTRDHQTTTHIIIVKALPPSNQTQDRQDLRLNLQRNVEVRGYIISTERDASACPEKHHRALQPDCVVTSVVDYDLGYEL